MAKEACDDDFSDMRLGGVGTTTGYTHHLTPIKRRQQRETRFKVSMEQI
jgi:hypothetical protein